jgi:hypothetical protein
MTSQKAQADVLLHRLHYALPGWDAAAERRDAHSGVRISFAKTDPFPKRTSGGKPVQGHGPVALTNPAQGEFASKKCSNMF